MQVSCLFKAQSTPPPRGLPQNPAGPSARPPLHPGGSFPLHPPGLSSSSDSRGEQPPNPDQMPPFRAPCGPVLTPCVTNSIFQVTAPSAVQCLGVHEHTQRSTRARNTSTYSSLNPQCLQSAGHCFTPEISMEGREASGEMGGVGEEEVGDRRDREGGRR